MNQHAVEGFPQAIADCNKVKSLLAGKKNLAVVDEGQVRGVKFLIILLGLLTDPATTFLIST